MSNKHFLTSLLGISIFNYSFAQDEQIPLLESSDIETPIIEQRTQDEHVDHSFSLTPITETSAPFRTYIADQTFRRIHPYEVEDGLKFQLSNVDSLRAFRHLISNSTKPINPIISINEVINVEGAVGKYSDIFCNFIYWRLMDPSDIFSHIIGRLKFTINEGRTELIPSLEISFSIVQQIYIQKDIALLLDASNNDFFDKKISSDMTKKAELRKTVGERLIPQIDMLLIQTREGLELAEKLTQPSAFGVFEFFLQQLEEMAHQYAYTDPAIYPRRNLIFQASTDGLNIKPLKLTVFDCINILIKNFGQCVALESARLKEVLKTKAEENIQLLTEN